MSRQRQQITSTRLTADVDGSSRDQQTHTQLLYHANQRPGAVAQTRIRLDGCFVIRDGEHIGTTPRGN